MCRLSGSDLAVLVSEVGDHGLSDLVCISELATLHHQSVHSVFNVLISDNLDPSGWKVAASKCNHGPVTHNSAIPQVTAGWA